MNRITRYLSLSLLILLISGSLFGQMAPPANLVTIPTAGTLQRGQYDAELLIQTGGGVLGRLGVGLSDRFSLGMSYGIQRFIGDEKPEINRAVPEAQLKYRLIDETYTMPAIALGMDNQGRGEFWEQEIDIDTLTNEARITMARYDMKAIGVYLVASKNWQVWGNLGTHFGICKNVLESDEADDDINFFFGFDKDLAPELCVFAEYNAALDDNNYKDEMITEVFENLTVGQGKGYLNAGFRWQVAPIFYLEVDMIDIMLNKGRVDYFSRELKVVYNEFF